MEAYGIGKGRNLRGGKAALRELHRRRASSPHREKAFGCDQGRLGCAKP